MRLTTPHRKKISLLQKITRSLRPGWILLINDLTARIGWDGLDGIDLA
jgi:hypothetical protein